MSKQTTVKWLVEQLLKKSNIEYINGFDNLVKQALIMEKQQIVNAVDGFPISKRHLDGEEYYNETYKQ